ncbi:unnamed protein product [Amoebophrya sp. A120]|nr:unnamed protein product [Amoebophrya sp. A120]|eukprot:GSA120T00017100001.1
MLAPVLNLKHPEFRKQPALDVKEEFLLYLVKYAKNIPTHISTKCAGTILVRIQVPRYCIFALLSLFPHSCPFSGPGRFLLLGFHHVELKIQASYWSAIAGSFIFSAIADQ